MRHTTDATIWEAYAKLPKEIRLAANRNFKLLLANPSHPSLKLKKVGLYWSARIGRQYRALATLNGSTFVWFWIGIHDTYERKL